MNVCIHPFLAISIQTPLISACHHLKITRPKLSGSKKSEFTYSFNISAVGEMVKFPTFGLSKLNILLNVRHEKQPLKSISYSILIVYYIFNNVNYTRNDIQNTLSYTSRPMIASPA